MTDQKSQLDRFKEAARELETDDDEERFNECLRGIVTPAKKVCPECGHVFKGNGWDGIDAHWRSKHEDVMSYEKVWPLLRAGRYH
tara:strand:- start:1186 stop:1440 length:255 start_codon:yes stop_codon:yes gene_type:complete